MQIGDMVRPVQGKLFRTDDLWLNRVGIIIGYHDECDYAGVPAARMPVVYWGHDFPCEEEYAEQIEVISVADKYMSSNMANRRLSIR